MPALLGPPAGAGKPKKKLLEQVRDVLRLKSVIGQALSPAPDGGSRAGGGRRDRSGTLLYQKRMILSWSGTFLDRRKTRASRPEENASRSDEIGSRPKENRSRPKRFTSLPKEKNDRPEKLPFP